MGRLNYLRFKEDTTIPLSEYYQSKVLSRNDDGGLVLDLKILKEEDPEMAAKIHQEILMMHVIFILLDYNGICFFTLAFVLIIGTINGHYRL